MLFFPFINIIINLLKFIYVPFILPFRTKARIYVYNYFLQNNKYFLIGYKELINNNYYTNKEIYIPYKKINKLLLFFYFYFVWIWLDDYNNDIICTNKLNLLELDKKSIEQLKMHNKKCYKDSFSKPIVNNYKSDSFIYLFYLSLFYSNNNFKNYFYYSTKKKIIFGRGYKKLVFFGNIPMYKLI